MIKIRVTWPSPRSVFLSHEEVLELYSSTILWKSETLQFSGPDNERPIQGDYCTTLRQHLASSDEQAGSLAEKE